MSKGHGLALGDFLGAGKFPAVITAAPIFPASPFRDMQGVRVIPAISSGASSSVVQNNQLLQYIIFIFFHSPNRDCISWFVIPLFVKTFRLV